MKRKGQSRPWFSEAPRGSQRAKGAQQHCGNRAGQARSGKAVDFGQDDRKFARNRERFDLLLPLLSSLALWKAGRKKPKAKPRKPIRLGPRAGTERAGDRG
jgi:hypothetical protein